LRGYVVSGNNRFNWLRAIQPKDHARAARRREGIAGAGQRSEYGKSCRSWHAFGRRACRRAWPLLSGTGAMTPPHAEISRGRETRRKFALRRLSRELCYGFSSFVSCHRNTGAATGAGVRGMGRSQQDGHAVERWLARAATARWCSAIRIKIASRSERANRVRNSVSYHWNFRNSKLTLIVFTCVSIFCQSANSNEAYDDASTKSETSKFTVEFLNRAFFHDFFVKETTEY
jgi:hypothetical protein